jgi:hypothetical protein
MGCPGMLKELRGATERKWPYVRKCRGSTIGVDLFIWLHQEIMNFFRDVVEHGATSPDYSSVLAAIKERVVRYVISGIRLFFVIDGRRLPGKYGTDAARAQRRAQAQAHIDAAVAAAGQRAAARRTRSANGRAVTFTPTHAPTTARHAQRSVFVFLRAVPTMFDPRTASALRACGAVEATGVPRTIWPRVASPVNPSGRPSWRPS